MKRIAVKYLESTDGNCAFYVDEAVAQPLYDFLNAEPKRIKKFRQIVSLILTGNYTSEQFGREKINKNCNNVYAIKMFKGSQNTRIYCQRFKENDVQRIVVIASDFLPKKKNQKLKATEINLIEKVSQYQFTLKDE